MKKVIVVGLGASGAIAAIKASENNEVLVLEKQSSPLKKILVTGNGKCNLWNKHLFKENLDIEKYYHTDNYDLLNKILKKRFEVYDFLTKDLNIFTKEKNEYIYPYSKSASSIKEILEQKLASNNVDVILNFEVTNIEKKNNKIYVYNSIGEYYTCDKLIISKGNKSGQLGQDITDDLENNLKVKLNEKYPSLVPITLSTPFLKEWNGIRTDAKLTLYNNDKLIKQETGEVQLTDYGISGIVTLNLSGYVNRLKGEKKIEIDFVEDISEEDFYNKLINIKSNNKVETVLETLFNYKLLFILLKKSNIKKDTIWNTLTKKQIKKLVHLIKHFECKVDKTLDFNRSQVTTGGISLKELDETLKIDKDIYVTGEVLDVDGICGGYNLAFAFITGFIVGEIC